MFEFLKDMLTEGAKNQLRESYDFQLGCDFVFLESIDIHKLDITYHRNSINVYLAKDTDGICKDVHFYPGYVIIRMFHRLEYGQIEGKMLNLELSYDTTEEELFQLSTVHDTTGIDLEAINLFRTIRDTYLNGSST